MKNISGLLCFLLTITCVQGYNYTYVGCFKDKKLSKRVFIEVTKHYFTNSPDSCARQCTIHGYTYFGLQEGVQCWCGNSGYDKYGPSYGCYFPCTGNIVVKCGGRDVNSVYKIVYTDAAPPQLTTAATTSTTTPSSTRVSATVTAQTDERTIAESTVNEGSKFQLGASATEVFVCAITVLVIILVIAEIKRAAGRCVADKHSAKPLLINGRDYDLAARRLTATAAPPNVYSGANRDDCVNMPWQATTAKQVLIDLPVGGRTENVETKHTSTQ